MSTSEFIKYARGLSTEFITQVSPDDILLLSEMSEKYPVISDFIFSLGVAERNEANNAIRLLYILKIRAIPEALLTTFAINGYLLLVFVTKDERLKRKMMDYLKSLGHSSVNFVLDRYFPVRV